MGLTWAYYNLMGLTDLTYYDLMGFDGIPHDLT